MKKVSCPACAATVEFRNAGWTVAVCPYCRSSLLRKDETIRSQGTIAALSEDGSVLRIGTRGKFAGAPFELTGRLQREWAQGLWSEWHARFPQDGRSGWLAEAMGFYYFTFEQRGPLPEVNWNQLKAGERIDISGDSWELTDRKQCTLRSAEGELPEPFTPGRESLCLDFVASQSRCLTVERSGDLPPFWFAGRFVEFDELVFTGLRKIDGW